MAWLADPNVWLGLVTLSALEARPWPETLTLRLERGQTIGGVVQDSSGQPVASAITNPSGVYTFEGLDAGAYTVFAEPMDQPFTVSNVSTLPRIYPSSTVNSNFTTRFR